MDRGFLTGIFHEVKPHASFPMKTHCPIPIGSVPTGLHPVNQTPPKGKNLQAPNPLQILWESYNSKEAGEN